MACPAILFQPFKTTHGRARKLNLMKFPRTGAEFCIVRLRGRSAEFLNAEEKDDEESYVTDRYAVFIYDKLNLRYYGVFLSNR